MGIQSINPFNGQLIREYEPYDDVKIESCLYKAESAYPGWAALTFEQRGKVMLQTGAVLRNEKEHYAGIITLEMGKTQKEAIAEIEKCAMACDYYAHKAATFLAEEKLEVEEGEAYVAYDPIGIVLAIMPWNFPFWQVFRFAAPTLMAGNVGLLKHASNVPQCALAIEEIFQKAGAPQGVFQSLLIENDQVNGLIDDNRVMAVTLTGSEWAGSKVGERAGLNIKKSVLELGGSDPFIVLEDADLHLAAKVGAQSRMINCGQSCIAAKRFIVVEKIADTFLELFVKEFKTYIIGDPNHENTQCGPLARKDLVEGLAKQVEDSVAKGAKILLGGQKVDGNGAFYQPTILVDVKPGMLAYEEELFGPVAAVIVVKDEEEAIKTANCSRYGLGGSIWTKDLEKGAKLARKVESGAVYINKMVASHPAVPFGGIKKSGYGRELSELGIKEFVNIKTVWIK
jgi:succinate-semialdehyde dehydrogenase / glutarate-semialdehyde dehydrogenase